jgi:hypothetical protein
MHDAAAEWAHGRGDDARAAAHRAAAEEARQAAADEPAV